MARPDVLDQNLGKILDDLYRTNAKIGSGSTAAAVRHELATGQKVGDRLHAQKATDSVQALQKWLSKNPAAPAGDRAAAENVIKDMQNALKGKR